MVLKAKGKFIDTGPIKWLLTVGEKSADSITFEVNTLNNGVDVSGCSFFIHAVNSEGGEAESQLVKTLNGDTLLLTWTVSELMTAVARVLRLEIVGILGRICPSHLAAGTPPTAQAMATAVQLQLSVL